ncbi:c-type cytochrome, partial [Sinomicrobium oceani]|uniref:c-type cytochrome n=1 Tax=Sinomicrobium oceani TaxID=1150368 RepID=UPI00227A38A0
KPQPFSRQVLTEADITDISKEAREYVTRQLESYTFDHKFTPPDEKGTVLFGYSGGAEWGGNAITPGGVLYQNANEEPWILQMTNIDSFKTTGKVPEGQQLYLKNCAMCHGAERKGGGQFPALDALSGKISPEAVHELIKNGSGRMPSFAHLSEAEIRMLGAYILDMPEPRPEKAAHREAFDAGKEKMKQKANSFGFQPQYVVKSWKQLKDHEGYPGIKPPWGTMNAIDLNTGKKLWSVPLGEYEALTARGIPPTGTDNYGGPVVTEGGLVFIAATKDEKIRAFDSETGEIRWQYPLPAAGFATPITYEIDGRQYLVIAAGGGRGLKSGGKYVAFAL